MSQTIELTPEQINQLIQFIHEGKYSWACVVMLRLFGENPLHFIPQRTYSRLMKENQKDSGVIAANTSKKLSLTK
ncbi:MAG TPA: HetP family heterocyst commitment protein [Nostocaceae cyanobacterium]|nr:HetP family heterocyst commitment protein [Nostocaceae cyanobacterium]